MDEIKERLKLEITEALNRAKGLPEGSAERQKEINIAVNLIKHYDEIVKTESEAKKTEAEITRERMKVDINNVNENRKLGIEELKINTDMMQTNHQESMEIRRSEDERRKDMIKNYIDIGVRLLEVGLGVGNLLVLVWGLSVGLDFEQKGYVSSKIVNQWLSRIRPR